MEIALAIGYIYPDLIRWTDYEVLDDNQWEWPYIKWFNKTIKQPTQAELETAWVEVVLLQEAEESKKAKKEAILNILSETDQVNLLATVLDIVTEWTTDPVILNAKSKFNEIKAILNS